ncbi:hypothetical protein C2E23DRAFT_858674 [Lenzites betulinus]|nr:hypothetical protein C2E23DRAFT_858674 [Lenzites betulinus]
MPAHTACVNCAERKVRCILPSPVHRSCQGCLERHIECVWPRPTTNTPGSATRRTACDFCHRKHHRCIKATSGGPCNKCLQYRKECKFTEPGAPTPGVAGPSSAAAAPALGVPGHLGGLTALFDAVPPAGPQAALQVNIPAAVAARDEAGAAGTTPAATSPNREWWNVVFAPSPEPSE